MTTRVTVSIPRDSGLEEDRTTNTFHFRTLTGGVLASGQVDAVAAALEAFYDDVPPAPATVKLSDFLSALNANPVTLDFYQLPAVSGPTGVPYAQRTFNATWRNVGSSDDTPEENAVCLSYRKVAGVGENQKRMRGRIYLGPMSTSAWEVSGGRVRVATSLQHTLTQAAKKLQEDVRAIGVNFDWVVHSPTTWDDHVIEEFWVDNAVDTIRSRGASPDARVTVTV